MSMTPSNNKSKIVDFPKDESVRAQAARWLAALDVEEPSEETLAAFKVWINRDERNRQEFEELAAFWGDLNILTQVTPPRTNQTAGKYNGIHGLRVIAVAAIMCVVVFSFLLFRPFIEPQVMTYATAIGEQKTIELPDRSVVFLNTNSRIVIEYTDKTRDIYLQRGEALFEVARDKTKPFEVHVGDRVVRAIGTAFSVYLQAESVEVLVTEGVVEIDDQTPLPLSPTPVANQNSAINQTEKVRVKAGSQALLSNDKQGLVQVAQLERIDDEVSWRTGVLTFDREPLEIVVNEVSRYTNTKFVVPDKEVREMIVGGVFKVGDIESLFEALQLGFGIQVHEVGDNVIALSRKAPKEY